MKFQFISKTGCAACEAVKASTLSKFTENVDYITHTIECEADWDKYEIIAVPAFLLPNGELFHTGIIGPIQLKKKLNELEEFA